MDIIVSNEKELYNALDKIDNGTIIINQGEYYLNNTLKFKSIEVLLKNPTI